LTQSAVAIAHLKAQRTAQLEERLRAGSAWVDTDHVFTTKSGLPMDPRNVSRAVTTAAKEVGLPDVNVHTLRHSAGSGYIRDGFTLIDVRLAPPRSTACRAIGGVKAAVRCSGKQRSRSRIPPENGLEPAVIWWAILGLNLIANGAAILDTSRQ
jgi:hypothetical protein